MRHILTVSFCGLAGFALQASAAPRWDLDSSISAVRSELGASADRIWPGYSHAPFSILYVTSNSEILLCDSRLPEGFKAERALPGRCSRSTGPTSWRKPGLLAAMPVFGAPSVIVVGSPSDTGLSQDDWERTILHEYFHVWQSQLPGYYQRTEALGLSGGDNTGMWMLNYPFPYQRAEVAAAHAAASRALYDALTTRDSKRFRSLALAYLRARAGLKRSVSEAEWRYYDFQLWQEGVARWTETELAKRSRSPSMVAAGRRREAQTLDALNHPDISKLGRDSVYPLGAGEAMLLERLDPDWRGCYRVSLGLDPCWDSLSVTDP